ncbi:alpha/beta hydrolase [Metabacillus sp. RGM 3146]|uniref:alpha/beta hydrolase n=1 Tax=Metabacillus sp. RGM 3146 TaxID=3401092 RepID=UPI003B99345D
MLEQFFIEIKAFQLDRLITVYLPKSYHATSKRYPVLYMHDGQNVFHDERAINGTSLGLEAYLDEHEIDVIVVGIDRNIEENGRLNEYCPWINGPYSEKILGYASDTGGKGKDYIDFIVKELKPSIDQKYRTDENRTYMAGISLGALITTYAVCRYPEIFKKAIALSSAYYRNQEKIEKLITVSDLSSIEKFYMDSGAREGAEDDRINSEFLAWNHAVYKLLKEKVTNLRFEIIPGAEHHYIYFKKRMPEAIDYILKD